MKIILPGIHEPIFLDEGVIHTLVIENQCLLHQIIMDLKLQINKQSGETVLSKNNEVLDISKNIDLITDIYSLSINNKSVLNKMIDELSKKAIDEENFESTMQLITAINRFILELTWDLDCEIGYPDLSAKQLISALKLSIVEEDVDLAEGILRYLEISRNYLGDKLFVFINLRSFIEDNEMKKLFETIILRQFHVLFLEGNSYRVLSGERRLTVDVDLCEF